jgi:ATP-binding protein involved in chromosome partitioning
VSEVDPLSLIQPAATRVRDPVTGRSVWLAGVVQQARVEAGVLRFDLVWTPSHSAQDRAAIREALLRNLAGLGLVGQPVIAESEREAQVVGTVNPNPQRPSRDPVPGMSGPGMGPHGGPVRKAKLPGVKHIIAVASGKGGVGKSTIACNLAVGLRLRGLEVGLMDADIYGPSLPVMMNVTARPMVDSENRVIPAMAYGVRCMSMGLVVDPHEAMIWRGPMVMDVVRKFLQDTRWGDIDVLVVDLPPGTGDAQLTLLQAVDLAGAVIVTTPQDVALADAVRGIQMFRKLDVPLLGVVQNMAWYQLPDGERDYVFGQGGGERIATEYNTRLLAELPLRTSVRRGGDAGLPAVLGDDDSAARLRELARQVAGLIGLDA